MTLVMLDNVGQITVNCDRSGMYRNLMMYYGACNLQSAFPYIDKLSPVGT